MKDIINSRDTSYKAEPYSFYIKNIIAKFDEKEKKEYDKINHAYNNCFLYAKQNKLEEAKEAYNELFEINKRISHSLISWVIVFCAPNLSYYYYKINDFKTAIDLTWNIIKSAKQLQYEGHPYLFFSEIQQLHNLSRIYFKLNDGARAVSLCNECISDIINHSKHWDTNNFINGVPEIEIIELTQYEMIIQVLTETCNRLINRAKEDNIESEKLLGIFIKYIITLDFQSVSEGAMYRDLTIFSSLMNTFLMEGFDNIGDGDLFFINSPGTNKYLLNVLYKLANMINEKSKNYVEI